MSPALPIPVIQVLQVVTIIGTGPGVSGVISKVEARLQGRRGPRVLQPYYDLAKLFRKEALAPEGASWVFLAAPIAAFTCYLTVRLLVQRRQRVAFCATAAEGRGDPFVTAVADRWWPGR